MNVLAKIALEQSHIERMGSCIESLETLVRNGTERQKGHAANALGNIACNDNMRKNIVHASSHWRRSCAAAPNGRRIKPRMRWRVLPLRTTGYCAFHGTFLRRTEA